MPAIKNNCAGRAVADVSAVPDPGTGVAVYDSYSYQGQSGWLVFGGTFVAAPLVGGVYGLAHDASSVSYGPKPYNNTASLDDVIGGPNGTCTAALLCNTVAGWDGRTGLGTPNGTGAPAALDVEVRAHRLRTGLPRAVVLGLYASGAVRPTIGHDRDDGSAA